MAQEIINNGTFAGDPSAENLYDAFEKVKNNFSELYSTTGWESKVDTTNVVSLTGATENIMQITTASESNGGLSLLDANAKITPVSLNDVIIIDFACTFVTPAGIEQTIDVNLKVGSNVYRAYNYKLNKGFGNDDAFSITWSLPCGASVMSNDVVIVLNPNSTMDYKDRFISVTRVHKGV